MDSDPHAPPAAPSVHPQTHQRSPDRSPHDETDQYTDEGRYQRQYYTRAERNSKGSQTRGHDSVISPRFPPKASSPPSPRSSISSGGRKHLSIDQIQHSPHLSVSYPPQAHVDPEKATSNPRSNRGSSNAGVPAVIYDSGEYLEKGPEEKAIQLLLFLSGPCAFLSLAITLWTTLLLLAALAMQPLRLCTTRQTLASQITAFLSPPLNLQLHLVYSHSAATQYSPAMLVVVHLFAPVVAVGVAIASWTAAFFWFFSLILGDPAGQDGHNDGRDSILGVRGWWERWLSRALR